MLRTTRLDGSRLDRVVIVANEIEDAGLDPMFLFRWVPISDGRTDRPVSFQFGVARAAREI
jgi:hypothetical protein